MLTKAAVTLGNGQPFEITDITIDEPKAGEVLIRIVGTGICHTDILAQNQAYPVPLPAVLGHEGAGIVEKVGVGIPIYSLATMPYYPIVLAALVQIV